MVSRRGFLKSGGLALFGIGLGGIPGFLAEAVAGTVAPPLFKKKKILVCIFNCQYIPNVFYNTNDALVSSIARTDITNYIIRDCMTF